MSKQTDKRIKITKCRHVTATEKKHLKLFIDSKMKTAKINRKHYELLSETLRADGTECIVRISTKQKNDHGKSIFEHQTITLKVFN